MSMPPAPWVQHQQQNHRHLQNPNHFNHQPHHQSFYHPQFHQAIVDQQLQQLQLATGNMPGIPMNVPLPPSQQPPTLPPPPINSNILTSPLPTALFPLPLDPLCPPAVMPAFSNGTNTSSGYSTAGHSRSSSPMIQPSIAINSSEKSINTSNGSQGHGNGTSSNGSSPHLSPNNSTNGSGSSSASSTTSGVGSSISSSSTTASQHSQQQPPHLHPHLHHHQQHHNHCSNFPSPNIVFEAPSTEITIFSHFPTVPGQYIVYFHINPGVSVSFQVGDQVQVIKGPMTVPLVSTNSNPPIPLPMQVPPGHVVQQIVDESGTLRHVIVSPQPPLMSIPAYGPGSQSQPFYAQGPGYPNPFAAMSGSMPCGMHPNQGPTPPPCSTLATGGTYVGHIPQHKDDRAQKQFVKPRRKFEQKQQREPTSYQNHYHQNGTYLRKDASFNNNNNNTRRNVPNGTSKTTNGGMEEDGSVGSAGSVTSTGTQDEEEESRLVAQTEMLSAIVPPIVSDVTCRSAFIKWSHPERFNEAGENKYPEFDVSDNEFRYEVFICDRSRADARFKSIFCGTAISCRVKDLKPGTIYAISYCAMLNDVKGNTSETVFNTLPSEPDAPQSPRAITRNRNALTFKWNPPNDNGSKITCYLLEYDEGKGGSHFVEAYRGKNKQCTVSKLQPAYSYQFRLAAFNEIGQSRFSPTTTVMTAGSPPAQPIPPTLTEAGVTYLTLEWKSRPTDDEYSLQMEDPSTGHGFLGAYSGNAPHCTCIGLKPFTEYKFRVKSYNSEGHSRWSDEVVFRTLPNRPGPPHKPALKGKVHATSFKVRWDPPIDDGGIPVSAYSLEIEQGNGGFEEIYRGPETEFNVDKLSPGQSYPLRVIAIGPGGMSDPSDPCVITTEPVCPGKCHIPRTVGKPKSNSVHLKWSSPDWDGGSPVNQYEVGCTTPDNQTQEAYRGKDTSCFVNGLLPGRSYLFQVRAYNRIGAGLWSDPLEIISGPGSPDAPSVPKVSNKSSHSVLVSWTEPLNNGSAITEYRVQMAIVYLSQTKQAELPLRSITPSTDGDDILIPTEDLDKLKDTETLSSISEDSTPSVPNIPEQPATFSQVYIGSKPSCEVKSLQPASVYLFRIQATNAVGSSEWSPVSTHQMPASSPNQVTQVEGVADTSSISLTWAPPLSNGSPILHYNLMFGETIIIATTNSYVLDNLMPDTHHKIRIQAVNNVGPGPFSTALKISTKPLPPQPPKLELVSATHFWIKLKWNSDSSQKNIEYIVQMMNPYQDEFQVVYRGSLPNCKVSRLTEETEYQFRISGLNAAGQGPFSEMYRFSTLRAPPPPVKSLKHTCVKEMQTHRFEWSEVSTPEAVYQLQLGKKNQEYVTIYRGEMKRYEMKYEELDAGVEYISRVCAIRKSEDGNDLIGPYSNLVNFSNPLPPVELTSKSTTSSSFKSNLSTTAQVLEQKVNSISYESRVGIMAVVALVVLAIVISFITRHFVT